MSKAPANNTVRLDPLLRKRVALAMQASGYKNFTDFCRGALMEKCRSIEKVLAKEHPDEFDRIYGRKPTPPDALVDD